ncbi:hypothetical protein FAZ19_16210 [Sphingobacterium alkalisoli]|uniref:Uncharacterized protein n=1 Tax=Sphingobacterium alkalisoli TaxID=1874115 RepID=A0A4U0GXB2_9SPHI|nr:hypothetical protein [Sphingobacterium alkalisoli]TJY63810.1 hypothetical protein FAZ19_16210 [Sphingobacterium alkalisoli]GGH24743.1 hypothetical protein GCM10011418_32860 [Sphingobacterium alkalisoli]
MNKKKPYTFEIFFGATIVLFLVLNAHLYGESDLAKRPYDSGSWGNVADWLTFIVTAFTAIFLVKTFREQQKLTEIEQSRHEFSLMPNFILKSEYGKFKLSLTNATAYDVKVKYLTEISQDDYIEVWHTYHNPIILNYPPGSIGNRKMEYIQIEFKNVSNQLYKQVVFQTESFFIIGSPEKLTN